MLIYMVKNEINILFAKFIAVVQSKSPLGDQATH